MKKNITIFFSSPRANGNSDKLACAFIEGALNAGHSVNRVYIRNLNIHGCLGCEYCYKHEGQCVQKDDMQQIYDTLEKTDIVVFATPIYYQSFPSQLKAVIDRLYVSENRDFPIKGAILLATYATPGEEMAEQTVSYYKCLIKYHAWENRGIITASGLDEKNDIDDNDVLQEALKVGELL